MSLALNTALRIVNEQAGGTSLTYCVASIAECFAEAVYCSLITGLLEKSKISAK